MPVDSYNFVDSINKNKQKMDKKNANKIELTLSKSNLQSKQLHIGVLLFFF